jgi:hypothetical protein
MLTAVAPIAVPACHRNLPPRSIRANWVPVKTLTAIGVACTSASPVFDAVTTVCSSISSVSLTVMIDFSPDLSRAVWRTSRSHRARRSTRIRLP